MPHNRTRIWVGLAIALVTIPAVGTLLYGASVDRSQSRSGDGPARWTAAGGRTTSALRLASRPAPRDYRAELDAALAQGATPYPILEEEAYANPFADDNPMFDVSPLGEELYDEPVSFDNRNRDLPDPLEEMAPVEPLDEPEDVAVADAAPVETPLVANAAGLSDRAVYTMVVDELAPEEREEFVRAWALMTVDQRADLIDEFRAKIEGEN